MLCLLLQSEQLQPRRLRWRELHSLAQPTEARSMLAGTTTDEGRQNSGGTGQKPPPNQDQH